MKGTRKIAAEALDEKDPRWNPDTDWVSSMNTRGLKKPKWLRYSRAKKVMFHASRSEVPFLSFDTAKGDLGAHFGTLEQAEHRANLFNKNASIFPAWLNIMYPLRLKDEGSFHADAIADQLAKKKIITRQLAKEIKSEYEKNWRSRKKYDPIVRQAIIDAGYDGVVYKNLHEGVGDSFIAFHPQQIKSAIANTGEFDEKDPIMTNPASYKALSYAQAHKWEPLARSKGVSKVARSSRGFMRALQRSGSVSRMSQEWQRKREAFIKRHMAQVKKNGERLWKDGKPSRRALALIMWAYMPPKTRTNPIAKLKPAPRTKVHASELRKGIKIEMEHTKDRKTAEIIARHHLAELPDYYTRLIRMERNGSRSNPSHILTCMPMPTGPKYNWTKKGWERACRAKIKTILRGIDLCRTTNYGKFLDILKEVLKDEEGGVLKAALSVEPRKDALRILHLYEQGQLGEELTTAQRMLLAGSDTDGFMTTATKLFVLNLYDPRSGSLIEMRNIFNIIKDMSLESFTGDGYWGIGNWIKEFNGLNQRQYMTYLKKNLGFEYNEFPAIKQNGPSMATRLRNRLKKNPSPRTKPSSEGMILGALQELEVRIQGEGGKITKIKPKGRCIGWLQKGKHLCVLKKTGKRAGKLSSSTISAHKRFHNANPSKAEVYEWPDVEGKLQPVGRIVSLTYRIPPGLKSPEKNKYLWKHEFGDHGERGHGTVRGSGNYPESLMPMLLIDEKGDLYIKRMPGNKYYVTDWLYW